MTALLADPHFWEGLTAGLLAGFLGGFLLAALLRGNDRPRVVGAIRPRCEICDGSRAVPSAEDDLDLCALCRNNLDEAARGAR